MLFADGPQRLHVAASGVGKQNVQPPDLFRNLGIDRVQIRQLRGIGTNAGCRRADGLNRCVQLGLATPGNKHLRALRRQHLCGCQTNAACATRN